ncbi:MAG TPA: hypothetical protein DEH78_21225, partial [Solibacterales bacterium]|nr:hypothetical protein [Bryobacterales bacterium]
MIRRLLPALIAATAGAQVWVDPKLPDGRKAIERFESAWTLTNPDPLKCEVRPIQPMLTFSFRYQAGFFLTLPLYQMDPGGSQVTMITSVRPLQAAQPVYFLQSFKVPKFPFENVSKRVAGEAGGGFYLGPGEYEVRWLLEDHRGRRCAESWKTRLKLSRAEKKQPQPLEPDTITPLILSGWNAESREGRPYRISILLHAAPSRLRGTALHPFDQALLISSVAALLEKTSMVEVSVTAFNLNQQR